MQFFICKSPQCFLSGEEMKNRFLRWPPSWISDLKDFNYFWSNSHPDVSYQVSSQWAFRFRRRSKKYIFKMAAIVAILDFQLEQFYLFLINKSPWCFLPSFMSIGLLVQKKKRKIEFQDGHLGSHLKFWIGTILAIFDLQVTAMLPTKFQVNWPFGSGWEAKNRFSHGAHFGFRTFDIQVTPMLPTKFQVNGPVSSGEAKNIFSRWRLRWPSCITN